MDVLTDLLRGVRSRNQIYGLLDLSAPWGLRVSSLDRLSFYSVLRGSAVLSSHDKSLEIGAGEVVLVRKGVAHSLKDRACSRTVSVEELFAELGGHCGGIIPIGGGGVGSEILAGGFLFETTVLDPLFANLPDLLHVRSDCAEAARLLESTLNIMASEMRAGAPGHEMIASRLADILFIHALRFHVRDSLCKSANWLTAITDPKLAAAFRRMHERPDEPWTVEMLARTAAMSRSAFAQRFTVVLGLGPLTYLTRWRMHRAAEMLSVETVNVCEIAARVGYETESAFAKVFKRHFGETPAIYRRRHRRNGGDEG
ncbi:AraC family transcriptional regulator [Nguyenibacter vanlangensis]|uniref:AraC family transcriptional regulator n=1 Tax=Nguyenibacter vanlangensis TaxID=1216886 RepID=A0ABZ3D9I0_9PROT